MEYIPFMTRSNFLLNQIKPHDCFIYSNSLEKKFVPERIHKEIKSIICNVVKEETIGCFEKTIGCFFAAATLFEL